MEVWRFLVSMCILLVIWALIVTALGDPPSPGGLFIAVIFAAIGLYLSERLVEKFSDG